MEFHGPAEVGQRRHLATTRSGAGPEKRELLKLGEIWIYPLVMRSNDYGYGKMVISSVFTCIKTW